MMVFLVLGPACSPEPTNGAHKLRFELALALGQADLLGPDAAPPPSANAGLALGDLDGDDWLDLLIVTPEGSLALQNDGGTLQSDGSLRFDGAGLPPASGAALGDTDNDGDLDLWLGTRAGEPDWLFVNDGAGRFTGAALPEGEGESTTGSFADIDADGDLDLFVARYAPELDPARILDGTLVGDGNAIYRNEGGILTPDPAALPAEVNDDLTFLGQWLDADRDGDPDLYLANDYGPFLGRNRLLLNDGAGAFTLDDACGCDRAMFAMGVAVGDPDNDADPDLYLTDLAGPDLLLNVGDGAFYDATAAQGANVANSPEHLASWGTALVDIDGDGWEDLPMVFGPLFPHGDPESLDTLGDEYEDWTDGPAQRDVLLRNTGAGFEDLSAETGFDDDGIGRALAVGDIDRDGQPDLVVAGLWYARILTTRNGTPGLRLHPAPEALGHWPGAKITAEYAETTRVRWATPAGTWSSSAPELLVPPDPIRVTVDWPDGRQSVHTPSGDALALAP